MSKRLSRRRFSGIPRFCGGERTFDDEGAVAKIGRGEAAQIPDESELLGRINSKRERQRARPLRALQATKPKGVSKGDNRRTKDGEICVKSLGGRDEDMDKT